MQSILVIEDELAIADAVLYALRAENYLVEHRLFANEGLACLREKKFDLLVLDVGLPDKNGFDVCRELRTFSDLPVIFLTARAGEFDRVLGLELGADDYMVKPFSPRELVARVRARLRRSSAPVTSVETWQVQGEFAHDVIGQRFCFLGRELQLTRYEYLLLGALLARPGAILSREQLMNDVWRDAPDSVDRTVDTHIKTLRSKLRLISSAHDPIQTHRGLGYQVKV